MSANPSPAPALPSDARPRPDAPLSSIRSLINDFAIGNLPVTLVAAAGATHWVLGHADDRSAQSMTVILAIIAAWSIMAYVAIAAAGITAGVTLKRWVIRATVASAPPRLVRLVGALSALVSFCACRSYLDPGHGVALVLLALLPDAFAGFLLARLAA